MLLMFPANQVATEEDAGSSLMERTHEVSKQPMDESSNDSIGPPVPGSSHRLQEEDEDGDTIGPMPPPPPPKKGVHNDDDDSDEEEEEEVHLPVGSVFICGPSSSFFFIV